jgi:predicted nucleic acid-binding protein
MDNKLTDEQLLDDFRARDIKTLILILFIVGFIGVLIVCILITITLMIIPFILSIPFLLI